MKPKISILCALSINMVLLAMTGNLVAASNVVAACGTAITSSGTWTLSQNLTCTGDGIDVEVSNVILKLNGFTITGPGANVATNGILIASSDGSSLNTVTILGPGTITNFQNGIVFHGTNAGGAVDVKVTGNLFGIQLQAPTNLVISQNNLQNNFNGISGQLGTSTIAGNDCSNNSDCINLFASSNNKILGNFCDGNRHAGMVIGGNTSGGASTGNTVEGNQTSNNRFYGIFLGPSAGGNHLVGNVALGNSFLDINEFNSHCGSDTFLSDVFRTSSQSCVK